MQFTEYVAGHLVQYTRSDRDDKPKTKQSPDPTGCSIAVHPIGHPSRELPQSGRGAFFRGSENDDDSRTERPTGADADRR